MGVHESTSHGSSTDVETTLIHTEDYYELLEVEESATGTHFLPTLSRNLQCGLIFRY